MTDDLRTGPLALIADLHARYSHAVDTRDAARLAECFEPHADLLVGETAVAKGAVSIAERLVTNAPPGVLHLVGTTTSIDRGGGTWSSQSYFQLYSAARGEMTAIGRYDDAVAVGASIARYTARTVHYLWRLTDG